MAFRIAELRRHHLVERRRDDRLADAGLHGVFETADIDGEQHVGRAVGALGLDALFEARNSAEMTLTLTPVSLVKASKIGWISFVSRYV